MDEAKSLLAKRLELVLLAQDMLSDKVNLIEGVRKICSLRFAIADPENDVFIPFRAIESETDHYPLGKARIICSEDYLRRVDDQIESYLENTKQVIFDGCRDIIRLYEK